MPTRRAFLVGFSAASLAVAIRHACGARAGLDRPAVSIKEFGAAGNGRADDSAAIQAAIDRAAQAGGGEVHVPDGVYLARGLRLRSNVRFVGEGRGRTLLREASGSAYLLSINPGKEGSADPSQNEHDIEIAHLALEGPVAAMGFAEHQHLLNFNGVTRLHVHDCLIRGFRGDGIYLGSGNAAGLERHNVDVRISGNEFDGVNCDNRNAISVVDGTGVVIGANRFVRCSRPNMPGPIDVEPNGDPFQRIRDIAIEENRFEDCGGNIAKIAVHIPVPEAFAGFIGKLRIAANVVAAGQRSGHALYLRVLAMGATSRRVTASGIEVVGNALSHGNAVLRGMDGFVVSGNEFAAPNGGLVLGALPGEHPEPADRGVITLNTFRQPANGAALVIGRARGLTISANRFIASHRPARMGPAILLEAERGKPLCEALLLEDNRFGDEYGAHLASRATAADVRIMENNATFSGRAIRRSR